MPRSLATLVLIGLATLPAAANADRLVKGRSLVEVGVSGYRAELASAGGLSNGWGEAGEVGVHGAYYRFLSDHWTLGVAGGYHVGQNKLELTNVESTVKT